MPDTMDAFIRAHTRLFWKPTRSARKPSSFQSPKWPSSLLFVDCVCSGGELRYGTYAKCRLEGERYNAIEVGLFHADNLTKQEQQIISRFSENSVYRIVPVAQFREETFLPLLAAGVMIAGWEMPRQLSTIALKITTAKRNKRAFSLYFATYDKSNGKVEHSCYWRGVRVQSLSAGQALYENLKISLENKKAQAIQNSRQIRILDLQSLTLALGGEVLTFDNACELFGLPRAAHHEQTARITKVELERAFSNILRELELLDTLRSEYQKHQIAIHPEKTISPAGITKGYMKQMGLRCPFASDKLHGLAMAALCAGRAECRGRRVVLPCVYVDFSSQFSACYSLLGCQELLTAERLELSRYSKQARELVQSVSVDRYLRRDAWNSLNFLAKVLPHPEGSILPVRGKFSVGNDGSPTIGWERVTGLKPMWVSGPTLIASALLGPPPKVISAVRIVPKGKQSCLKQVTLYGEVPCDPLTDSLPEKLTELRSRLKKTNPVAAAGIKVQSNSAAFGVFCETNLTDLNDPKRLHVFSGNVHFQTEPVESWEKPGTYYCPAIASLVTGGSHLLLAMLERMALDAGASIPWVACDTDGATLLANETGSPVECQGGSVMVAGEEMRCGALQPLSWKQVEEIRERFQSLNPRPGTEFLKIEGENFADDGKTPKQLLAYSAAGKRNCLFNYANGQITIRKPSGHALGWFQPPYSVRDYERRSGRAWQEDLAPWVWESWHYLLSRELGLPANAPRWFSLPPSIPFAVSTPEQWRKIGRRLRPFSMVSMPLTEQVKFLNDLTNEEITLPGHQLWITNYTRDLRKLSGQRIINLETGSQAWLRKPSSPSSPIEVRAKTIGGYLEHFLELPESRFNSADGENCRPSTIGVLHRKQVQVGKVRFIGRETSHRWIYGNSPDMIAAANLMDEQPCREYIPPEALHKESEKEFQNKAIHQSEAARAREFSIDELATEAGVSRATVVRFRRTGKALNSTRAKIKRALIELEQKRAARERRDAEAAVALAKRLTVRKDNSTLPAPSKVRP